MSSYIHTIFGAFSTAIFFHVNSVIAAPITIDFDSLDVDTIVSNQYPQLIFSSNAGFENITLAGFGGASNNIICTAAIGGAKNCNEETILDFISPVNNFSFYGAGINDFGTVVAKVDVFTNTNFNQTIDIIGNGDAFTDMLIDLSMFNNITSVKLHSINDTFGIGWDKFSFDTTVTAIPLPASIWLFSAGLIALLGIKTDRIHNKSS